MSTPGPEQQEAEEDNQKHQQQQSESQATNGGVSAASARAESAAGQTDKITQSSTAGGTRGGITSADGAAGPCLAADNATPGVSGTAETAPGSESTTRTSPDGAVTTAAREAAPTQSSSDNGASAAAASTLSTSTASVAQSLAPSSSPPPPQSTSSQTNSSSPRSPGAAGRKTKPNRQAVTPAEQQQATGQLKQGGFVHDPSKISIKFIFANRDGLSVIVDCKPSDTVGETKGALLSVWPEDLPDCSGGDRIRLICMGKGILMPDSRTLADCEVPVFETHATPVNVSVRPENPLGSGDADKSGNAKGDSSAARSGGGSGNGGGSGGGSGGGGGQVSVDLASSGNNTTDQGCACIIL